MTIDQDRLERAARELLLALGADVDSDGLRDTPRRVADAYSELLTPQPFRATTFPKPRRGTRFSMAWRRVC